MDYDRRRVEVMASFVKEGRSMSIGDLLFGCGGENILDVTGWSPWVSLEQLTKKRALSELENIKMTFSCVLQAYPDILPLCAKNKVKFILGFDCGKSAIHICSELDGHLTWKYKGLQ